MINSPSYFQREQDKQNLTGTCYLFDFTVLFLTSTPFKD